jgi:hypothetical protein
MVEHGHRLEDGCRAAEMAQAPGHVDGLAQQRVCPGEMRGATVNLVDPLTDPSAWSGFG